jgi:putative CocE/NonD family hydrolase
LKYLSGPFSLLLICYVFNANAQQVYLPKKILNDTAALKSYMPVISKVVINKLNHSPDKKDSRFYGNYAALQILAGLYNQSQNSIDTLRVLYAKETGTSEDDAQGIFSIFETYAQTKLLKQKGETYSEERILKDWLTGAQQYLKGKALQDAMLPYKSDEATMERLWQQALGRVRSAPGDSVSLMGAVYFAYAYLQHIVTKTYLPMGKKIMAEMDNADYTIQDSVMITMRDGVKLSAVIVRSKKVSGPQPVIMLSNIYATTREASMCKNIAVHGYVGIILNTRGKYVSDAKIEPWEHDAEDTYDAIDWISKQNWCNGKVGMYGGSYLGFSQWAAAKKLHPALKTIVPQVAAAPGIDFPANHGVHSTYMLRWINYVMHDKLADLSDFTNTDHWNKTFNQWYMSGKPFNALDSIEGRPSEIFHRWLKHPSYDKYWQNMIPYQKEFAQINIPVLTITGYYDAEQFGALYYYQEHYNWNSKADDYLVIGPYDHGGAQGAPSPTILGYNIDPVAKVDITKLVFDWFDYTLKGAAKPELLKDKVNFETMGANTWNHAPSLQKMNTDTLRFYLSGTKSGKYNTLSRQSGAGSVDQQRDFTKRSAFKFTGEGEGRLLQDTLDSTNELIFVSDILKDDIIINGGFVAKLTASINKKDMDVSISLYQQQPDGKYFYLSGITQRASYAKNRSKRILLTPQKKEMINCTANFISKKITKGSRLIIKTGTLVNPYMEINYGTGRDVSTESIADAKEPLQIKWYGSSLIEIPIFTQVPILAKGVKSKD